MSGDGEPSASRADALPSPDMPPAPSMHRGALDRRTGKAG